MFHGELTALPLRPQLWQWVGQSVILFVALPPNRTQTMTISHSGTLVPEIVRWVVQDLLEPKVSAAVGGQLQESRPDERAIHCNGYRERLHTTHMPGASLSQPALPRALNAVFSEEVDGPGHGGGSDKGGVRNPGPRSGTSPLAACHRDADQAVPHCFAGAGGRLLRRVGVPAPPPGALAEGVEYKSARTPQ